MTRRLRTAVLLGSVALALVPAAPAAAHPLGNFTVNTADQLRVTQDGVVVTHVVDLAEIPTVQLAQARAGVDTDGDGELSAAELTAHASAECGRTTSALTLTVDGQAAPLDVSDAQAQRRPGTAGLPTTRLTCRFSADGRPRASVAFDDAAARDRNGWREVTAVSECGPLSGSTVPEDSPSSLLTSYPEDLLQSPADVSTARFEVEPAATCTGSGGTASVDVDAVAPRGVDRLSQAFTGFLGRPDLTLPFALVSLLAAVLFGVLHALAPGHGKTVMAAYLVGQRGTRRQALQLGAVVTFTHTASVLLLGAVLALGALAAPELVVPATEVVSGVLLVAVGAYLLVLAARRWRGTESVDHAHDHGHAHPHGDVETDHPHDHHHPHDHDHPHDQDHPHDPHETHDHAPAVRGGATSGATALATRPLTHSHGGRAHTHAPLPDGPLSWRSLAAMGVAGGLVPSPSALLVLLSATALGRAWFGVVLVVAYGVGMAVTLTAAGLLLLRARAALDRRGWSLGPGRSLARLVPVGTAAVVVLVGLGLVLRGLASGRGLL